MCAHNYNTFFLCLSDTFVSPGKIIIYGIHNRNVSARDFSKARLLILYVSREQKNNQNTLLFKLNSDKCVRNFFYHKKSVLSLVISLPCMANEIIVMLY